MANQRHTSHPKGGRPAPGSKGSTPSKPPEKTANWAGAPGKKRPQNFSAGMKKIKQFVKDDC